MLDATTFSRLRELHAGDTSRHKRKRMIAGDDTPLRRVVGALRAAWAPFPNGSGSAARFATVATARLVFITILHTPSFRH